MRFRQFIEQRLRFLQIERVEPSVNPAIDESEQIASLVSLARIAKKPRRREGLAGVMVQEAQGLLVELGYALINGRVRTGLKHQKFVRLDSICQGVGEAQRGCLPLS
jgi:hypothetical protein